ncbi:YbhB/YbcL family Raf kinase inhibitor-like protein [Methanocella sp. CWC-04]|uniref:YbhB/YbcL family Raf kinase inhibitor-like protein n=1 Tax=Methanooceanicella nereidis TaxID=2052831 RepID=A0AAP2W840_9EURY|nr:YbhB/YbcL family Raf kinase inhibitor-like protein [Methanocella sp. CWC-04]MCD1295874.1 YbhB/YbcL family Raf kinase inhibitor-like protein [Methanocella sp. CWC-04]
MPETANDFIIYSKVIVNGGKIPAKYTCDGEDISPQLSWSGAPAGTVSYALIVDDPDAPGKEFTHWVVYNLPADMVELEEGMAAFEIIKKGGSQGKNDLGMQGYGGPCPPKGKPHRYRFRIYALDTKLDLPSGVTKNNVMSLMKRHILAEAGIVGLYKRV